MRQHEIREAENKIISTCRTGPHTSNELAEAVGLPYHTVYRLANRLVLKEQLNADLKDSPKGVVKIYFRKSYGQEQVESGKLYEVLVPRTRKTYSLYKLILDILLQKRVSVNNQLRTVAAGLLHLGERSYCRRTKQVVPNPPPVVVREQLESLLNYCTDLAAVLEELLSTPNLWTDNDEVVDLFGYEDPTTNTVLIGYKPDEILSAVADDSFLAQELAIQFQEQYSK